MYHLYLHLPPKKILMKQLFTLSLALIISGAVSAQKKKATTATAPVKKTQKADANKPISVKVDTKDVNDGGHDIAVTITPAKNQKVFLGSYYGKSYAIVDSCILDENCKGHFKGSKKLTGGIYLIVSPQYSMWYDLLVGKEQNFSFVGDTANRGVTTIKGSPDNDVYKKHTQRTNVVGEQINKLTNEYKAATTAKDSTRLRDLIRAKYKEMEAIKDELIKTEPNSLMAALLAAMKVPESPEIPVDPITKKADSTYPYRFVKEHYFDDVNFADERLLRTPFYEKKIDDYYKYYVSAEADSIIPEVKYMLLSARESKEMYAYLLIKFTNKYMTPEYMGQDKVFVYLFTDYYLKGDTTILDAKSRKSIVDRGYSMMLGLIGNIASPLDLTDTTGKVISMFGIKSKFTFIAYFDPTCGHCRQEIPVLDSIYRAKWKNEGVTVYAIISQESLIPDLKKFIKEKNLPSDWYYTYETKAQKEATEKAGIPNFRQAYDFNRTPIFYLLDSEKRIVGKQLTIHQLDNLINNKLKSK